MGYEIPDDEVEELEEIFDGVEDVRVQGQSGSAYGEAITVEYGNGYIPPSIGQFTEALELGYVVDNVGNNWFQLSPIDVSVDFKHNS